MRVPRPRRIVVGIAVTAAYLIAAEVGFNVAFAAEQITTVWLPTGIAIAALVLWGPGLWPAVWIGAFAANASTSAPISTAVAIATGNTLEGLFAATMLQRVARFDPSFRRVTDAIAFLLIAALASSTIAATIGVTTLCAAGVQPWTAFGSLWSDWTLGDAVGALTVSPVLLTWFRDPFRFGHRQLAETTGLVVLTLLVTAAVFGPAVISTINVHPLEFIIFPLVIAAAVRLGQPATSLVILTASMVTVWATVHGSGPFATDSVRQSLILLQTFMGVLASSGLVLAAAITERRLAEQRNAAARAVGEVLANSSNIEAAAPGMLRLMCTHLDCQFAALWMADDAAQEIRCVSTASQGVNADAFIARSRSLVLARGAGLPGRIWAEARPISIEDVVLDSNFPRAAAAREANLHGAFGFPVWLDGGVIGIVEFFYRRMATADAELLSTISTIGHQIGQFIGRTRVELAMRDSEQRTRAVLETALDAIVSMDHRGLITEFNQAAERIFGYRRDEVIGRELATLLMPPHLRDDHRIGLHRFLSTGTGPFMNRRIETTAIRADGRTFPAEVSITAVPSEGAPRFTGFVRDVTERMQAEQERQQLLQSERAARMDAETASHAKDQFLATISHELRTPLNAIVGWTRMLLDGAVTQDSRRRAVEVIERNAQMQVRLVADLLDVSRIITGRLKLEVQPVDLGAIVGASLDAVRPAADAKQIAMRSTLPPGAVIVPGDPARLQQIVWNLLSNAVKFTPPGGHVHVDVADHAEQVTLRVKDSGPGVHPDFLPHVFERFRQADGSSTRQHGGLGLGLSIVRHLVELHGGTVRAANQPEGGALFWLELPRLREDAWPQSARPLTAGAAPEAEPHRTPHLVGCRVLVVDDEEDTRELFARILLNAGADVATAASAREALLSLEANWPDVLLADIAMPEQDGYALIRQVRALGAARGRYLPSAAITAYGRHEDRERARSEGFDLHVSKPVQPRAMVEAVASLWRPSADKVTVS